MNINTTARVLGTDQVASSLVEYLRENSERLNLNVAEVYFDFPILKDLDDLVVISKLLIVSQNHGIIAVSTSNATNSPYLLSELRRLDNELDNLFSLLYS